MSHTQWMKSPAGGPTHSRDIGCERFGCVPLAVIDPESSDDLDRLCKALVEKMHTAGDVASAANGVRPATVAAALREFANPKPPKPDEPQGLGAVVEDADGVLWIRHDSTPIETHWINTDDCHERYRRWDGIDAVRVLSEGVQP